MVKHAVPSADAGGWCDDTAGRMLRHCVRTYLHKALHSMFGLMPYTMCMYCAVCGPLVVAPVARCGTESIDVALTVQLLVMHMHMAQRRLPVYSVVGS